MKRTGSVALNLALGIALMTPVCIAWLSGSVRPSADEQNPAKNASTVSLGNPDPPTFTLVEPWGQDIDGDGFASTAEGAFDLDGDGMFTQLEADDLGMDTYIRWMPRDEYEELLRTEEESGLFTGRVCASACVSYGGGFICQSNLVTVNCIDYGTGYYSVPCGGACHCPP